MKLPKSNTEYDRLKERYNHLKKLSARAKKHGYYRKAVDLERAALRTLQEMRSLRE